MAMTMSGGLVCLGKSNRRRKRAGRSGFFAAANGLVKTMVFFFLSSFQSLRAEWEGGRRPWLVHSSCCCPNAELAYRRRAFNVCGGAPMLAGCSFLCQASLLMRSAREKEKS